MITYRCGSAVINVLEIFSKNFRHIFRKCIKEGRIESWVRKGCDLRLGKVELPCSVVNVVRILHKEVRKYLQTAGTRSLAHSETDGLVCWGLCTESGGAGAVK